MVNKRFCVLNYIKAYLILKFQQRTIVFREIPLWAYRFQKGFIEFDPKFYQLKRNMSY